MKDILLVDDTADILCLYRELLENRGFSVRLADNGSDALKVLAEKTPDLVILDIMMEPMSGWEVLSLIRNNIHTKNVPVIVLTGKIPLPQEIIGYEGLLNGFAMKPLRMKEFEGLISGFFAEENDIAKKCENARKSGADEAVVSEYARLCNNVRVLRKMLDCLYKVMKTDSSIEDKGELSEIVRLLDAKRARLSELEIILN
ncbi:response regulator [Methanomicrobium antiquum]|uniref:Response regulator n=1 Tax=Methanomicrobium antiquum TaxID=487686 RepID=A0AAF0FRJ7_9EURY|nr:response regulator [Methanomicrobium antiquum]MDD4300035.1 response regulator [Methanomicrobium sp.]WFN37247.1 response regulator [Methanomicrobium antiquum]